MLNLNQHIYIKKGLWFLFKSRGFEPHTVWKGTSALKIMQPMVDGRIVLKINGF